MVDHLSDCDVVSCVRGKVFKPMVVLEKGSMGNLQ